MRMQPLPQDIDTMNNSTCTAMPLADLELRLAAERCQVTSDCDDLTQFGYAAVVARKLMQAPAIVIRVPYQR